MVTNKEKNRVGADHLTPAPILNGMLSSNARASYVQTSGAERASVTIEVTQASRSFGAHRALENISLRVHRGEIHALLGPNGAGKTTLLRLMVGLLAPTSGSVAVLGCDPAASERSFRRRIAYLAGGDRSFYARLSGLENLRFFGRMQGFRGVSARCWEMLEHVGLRSAAHVAVGKYSHGMQKRLAVARALLTDPTVLFVDEATHDLDPIGARQIRALFLSAAARGATVVWATQVVQEIVSFADSVTVLAEGRMRFTGSVTQLSARSGNLCYRLRLERRDSGARGGPIGTDAIPHGFLVVEEGTNHLEGTLLLSAGAALGDALGAIAARGFVVTACQSDPPEIEQAFLRLTAVDPP